MPEPELFLLFVRPLNRASIRYVLTWNTTAKVVRKSIFGTFVPCSQSPATKWIDPSLASGYNGAVCEQSGRRFQKVQESPGREYRPPLTE